MQSSWRKRNTWFEGDGFRQGAIVAGAVVTGVVGGLAVVALPNPVIAFGAVVGLVVGFFMLGRPLFTLMVTSLIAAVIPFGIIPVKLGLTLTLVEAGLLMLVLVWLFSYLRNPDQKFVSGPFDWAILLLAGMCVFALILGAGGIQTLDIWHNFFKLLLAMLSYFAVINLVRDQATLDRLLRVMMVAGSIAGYIGVGLYALPRSLQERFLRALQPLGYPVDRVLRYVEDDPQKPQRATGLSIDPNSYGGLLVLFFVLLACQFLSPKPLFKRWQIALLAFGPTAGIVLTYGRGAQLAMGVLAILLAFKYRRLWLYFVPIAIIGIIVLPTTYVGQRLLGSIALQDQATLMRFAEYQNALDIISRYPFFGIGFGLAPQIDLVSAPPSMIYLTIAIRLGLVGLGCYLLVIVLFFVHAFRNLGRLQPPQQANLLGFVGGIIGALAVGLVDHYFFNIEYSHMTFLFWLFIALAVAQIKISEEKFFTAETQRTQR